MEGKKIGIELELDRDAKYSHIGKLTSFSQYVVRNQSFFIEIVNDKYNACLKNSYPYLNNTFSTVTKIVFYGINKINIYMDHSRQQPWKQQVSKHQPKLELSEQHT